ncbi:hypothetical protein NQZ79_g1010 [Umbelopsis isabellina]|nr:hypothetical protein NQZ79_g1010 [Umbelopsis isabellina]
MSALRETADKVAQAFQPNDHNEIPADQSAGNNAAEEKTADIKSQGNISAEGNMADKAQKDTADRSARYGGATQPTQ